MNFHYVTLVNLLNKDEIHKLHGKIDQKKRSKIYQKFRAKLLSDQGHQILLTTDLSARGIDIPDVDWIIQFDPPQWSDSFVHRIGRTARAGRQGQSILFLTEPEVSYLSFLAGKKVDIKEFRSSVKEDEKENSLASVKSDIQSLMLSDKDVVDKSQDAFVSFIRYYKEH